MTSRTFGETVGGSWLTSLEVVSGIGYALELRFRLCGRSGEDMFITLIGVQAYLTAASSVGILEDAEGGGHLLLRGAGVLHGRHVSWRAVAWRSKWVRSLNYGLAVSCTQYVS